MEEKRGQEENVEVLENAMLCLDFGKIIILWRN